MANKATTLRQLADELDVSYPTFLKYIAPIKHRLTYHLYNRRNIIPIEEKIIRDFLGMNES